MKPPPDDPCAQSAQPAELDEVDELDEVEALVRNAEYFCRVLNEPQAGHWRSSSLMKPGTKTSKSRPHSRQHKIVRGHGPSLVGLASASGRYPGG